MNDEKLRGTLQETLQAMRRYGLDHAIRFLDTATKGVILAGPDRRGMVRDVLRDLGQGSDKMLYRALDYLSKTQREPAADLYSYVADRLGKTRSEAKRDVFMHAYGKTNPQLSALQHDPKLDQLMADVKAKIMHTTMTDAILTGTMNYASPLEMSFADIERRILATTQGTQPVNKTIADIQAELDAAVAAKAEKDIIDQRAAELARYFRLHAATGAVLTDIRDKAITPRALTAEFRSELKALAAEFGYRIVLVGDRTQATLVQA